MQPQILSSYLCHHDRCYKRKLKYNRIDYQILSNSVLTSTDIVLLSIIFNLKLEDEIALFPFSPPTLDRCGYLFPAFDLLIYLSIHITIVFYDSASSINLLYADLTLYLFYMFRLFHLLICLSIVLFWSGYQYSDLFNCWYYDLKGLFIRIICNSAIKLEELWCAKSLVWPKIAFFQPVELFW